MRDEPKDLPHAALADVLQRHWGIDTQRLEYVALGAGSWHWIAEESGQRRWFVTADSLQPPELGTERTPKHVFADLRAAYETAAALRGCGLAFVVAPVADQTGQQVRRASPHWAVAVFPYVEGDACGPGEWTKEDTCAYAAGLVGQLHATNLSTPARRWQAAIPHRITFSKAIDKLDRPWTRGPYGERVRALLASRRQEVEALFARYDHLADAMAANDAQPRVITHGEPHSANFIRDADGRLHLIDWDTVCIAPRERDLTALLIDDPDVLAAYQRTAGRHAPRPEMMELFHLRWVLSEICEYVTRFRGPHGDGLDDRTSFEELIDYLPGKEADNGWPKRTHQGILHVT